MRTFNEVKEIYENGHIVELAKEEIEKYFILKDYIYFTYIGQSNRYQNTIILETTKGLLYIYENKIMDRPRIKEDEDDLVLKDENQEKFNGIFFRAREIVGGQIINDPHR